MTNKLLFGKASGHSVYIFSEMSGFLRAEPLGERVAEALY